MSKTITQIADDIYINEFKDVSGAPSSSAIESWLGANVGGLNVLINTAFTECSEIDTEAAAIFYNFYMRNYFNKESQKVLRGITTSMGVISIREGDSTVTFTNKNEIAKTLKGYALDYSSDLNQMVAKYNLYAAMPRQVYGDDAFHPTVRGIYSPPSEVRDIF